MDGWIEIFRTGRHTDSHGGVREWTEADLDDIARRYDPAMHLAPVVIGHPRDNAPAWAWAAAVKREGGRLYYTERDAQPEFDDMRRRGLFRKRSISLYADGSLRHIGWLGAMPPAVKGLADVAFAEDDGAITIEFEDRNGIGPEDRFFQTTGKNDRDRSGLFGRVLQRLREYFIEEAGEEAADRIVSQKEIDELQKTQGSAQKPRQEAPSAGDGNAPKGDARTKAKGEAVPEAPAAQIAALTEQLAEARSIIDALHAELAAQGAEKRRGGFTAFCDGLAAQGRLTPAQRGTVLDFMEILHGSGEYEFAEAGKKSALEEFKAFLGALPVQVEFAEIATRRAAGQNVDTTDAWAIAKKAREYQESEEKAGRQITISQAVEYVTKGGIQ